MLLKQVSLYDPPEYGTIEEYGCKLFCGYWSYIAGRRMTLVQTKGVVDFEVDASAKYCLTRLYYKVI